MSSLAGIGKRLFLGSPVRSEAMGDTLLPKKLALPIFASDTLSSVAYATQEVLVVLTLGGLSYLYLTPYLALAVFVLLAVVVASYRQLVHAYPSGGGDYEVASKNIGRPAGLTVASALMIDYVLTVAVSVSAGVDNIISAFSGLNAHRVIIALGFVLLLAAINLRGTKESGKTFAVPSYAFVAGILIMIVVGLVRTAVGDTPHAVSAGYDITPEKAGLAGLAFVFFVLRAFSSGCTALTGVEAIANGVPAFQEPKSKNAATTLALMGGIAMTLFLGLTALAVITKVHYVDPANLCNLVGFVGSCTSDAQQTVIAQVATAVFGQGPLFYYIQGATALILILAANTAFNGFPLLGSILAQDRVMPRQLHTRGDRLVYSNGLLVLSTAAALLIFVFHADVTKLIQLYIVGVFTSFTLGQTGMVRHWNRLIPRTEDAAQRSRMRRARIVNGVGATLTGLVLIIVTITKFTHGAYLVVIMMPVLYLLMVGIHRHYSRVAAELTPDPDEPTTLPSRATCIVLVSKLHKPTLRALAYARATRPDTLIALTVAVDADDTAELQQQWERLGIPLPLTVLHSPYREITRPVLAFVAKVRRKSPRDVVTVFIPEYVVGHWWEQILHNQSALRLKSRLLFQPGVMVTSVPYQLHSSHRRAGEERDLASPGDMRRGGIASGASAAGTDEVERPPGDTWVEHTGGSATPQ